MSWLGPALPSDPTVPPTCRHIFMETLSPRPSSRPSGPSWDEARNQKAIHAGQLLANAALFLKIPKTPKGPPHTCDCGSTESCPGLRCRLPGHTRRCLFKHKQEKAASILLFGRSRQSGNTVSLHNRSVKCMRHREARSNISSTKPAP